MGNKKNLKDSLLNKVCGGENGEEEKICLKCGANITAANSLGVPKEFLGRYCKDCSDAIKDYSKPEF